MKLELANIATNEKHKLNGFKILGLFPFYLRFIRTDTHIQLSKIRAEIQSLTGEAKINDFYDTDIQSKAVPLINKYCVTALVNNRFLGFFVRFFLKVKIKSCSHSHINNLYKMIQKLEEPAFFFGYWNDLKLVDNTLLSEVKQSSEKSLPIKKKQA